METMFTHSESKKKRNKRSKALGSFSSIFQEMHTAFSQQEQKKTDHFCFQRNMAERRLFVSNVKNTEQDQLHI